MTQTLTTEQLRARAKFWREKAVEAKWESVSIAQDMLLNADAFEELAANREAQPVGKAEITKIAAELVRGDYLSKLWAEAEKSRHVDTHRLQNLLDELHDVMKVKAIAITRLLTAPPAPAVPEEITEDEQEESVSDGYADSFRGGWNACRTAMLAQPVSGGYKLITVDFLTTASRLIDICRTHAILNDGDYKQRTINECENTMKVIDDLLAAAPEGGNG